jgi:hypothetical protein
VVTPDVKFSNERRNIWRPLNHRMEIVTMIATVNVDLAKEVKATA